MSDNRIISGTPWHTERVHRAEGDERRHKSRCYYYLDDDNHCRYSHTHCIGSAHCNYYKAISDDEFKQRQKAKLASQKNKQKQKNKKKVNNDDDIYWYDF